MKEKMNIEQNFNEHDWEELASVLSDEKETDKNLLDRFLADKGKDISELWRRMGKMKDEKEINVDNAWSKLYSRLHEAGYETSDPHSGIFSIKPGFLRIAATILILLSLGIFSIYLASSGRQIVVTTDNNQKNIQVNLPDGSNIFLNRNTELIYNRNFGKRERHVALSGEAFFEISPDITKPFSIDAGGIANIEVVGTSFNIITNNADSAVEVYVETGKVVLSDNSKTHNLVLDPGYVGTIDAKDSRKILNNNPNYISWKTGRLVFESQRLEQVFHDLKRVYNMVIIADNPEILDEKWTSSVDNQSQDTIIRLICASFNLRYAYDGNVYHLMKE